MAVCTGNISVKKRLRCMLLGEGSLGKRLEQATVANIQAGDGSMCVSYNPVNFLDSSYLESGLKEKMYAN